MVCGSGYSAVGSKCENKQNVESVMRRCSPLLTGC